MLKAILVLAVGGILSSVAEASLVRPGGGVQECPDCPLIILVHGVDPEADFFDPLARELALQGNRILYFEYDSRRRLDANADLLVDDIRRMRQSDPKGDLTFIAHSMGGLITRRAMSAGREKTLADGQPLRLLTIATPFAGYDSANPTRHRMVRILFRIFGVTEAQQDIASKSDFIQKPGELGKGVTHSKIETLEDGQRRINPRGKSVKDATVECGQQQFAAVDDEVSDFDAFARGHMAILNDGGLVPPASLEAIERWLKGEALAGVRCTDF